ncbi:GNAT family N-acetyltransferase [Mucilaginibacter sp. KACC 22773]|jgi:GNAT superfamily N-acetyltransferase|uniref:GNAT family N-acetyltransferase n=1 Tax=Mucilaginibacter sp. KACC 22773 TaxID=3025671 RepID=UPI0023670D5A|nr:GNAT family N-acetyltransferase [Mucilaginibacter sp. KACC 22773]WDF80570.1 GNAT family N-acetyltransferase [Mucilaginibacter sp. KACC 22773]
MTTFIDDTPFIEKGFIISTDKNLLPIDVIFNYLNDDSYWAQGIPRQKLENAIENSMCFGVYNHTTFAGFARIITDKATFAYLCDVFILPEFRKKDLSKWLMQTIVKHPDLQGLRRWSLATADAHGLYGQFGFSQLSKPQNWMEIFTPYIKPQ